MKSFLLHNVLLIKAGNSILKRPASGIIYRPLIKGHTLSYSIRRSLMSLFVRKL